MCGIIRYVFDNVTKEAYGVAVGCDIALLGGVAMSAFPTFLSVEEVCEKLQVSKPTLYRWTHRKEIPFYKIGKHLRFSQAEVLDWLTKRRELPQ